MKTRFLIRIFIRRRLLSLFSIGPCQFISFGTTFSIFDIQFIILIQNSSFLNLKRWILQQSKTKNFRTHRAWASSAGLSRSRLLAPQRVTRRASGKGRNVTVDQTTALSIRKSMIDTREVIGCFTCSSRCTNDTRIGVNEPSSASNPLVKAAADICGRWKWHHFQYKIYRFQYKIHRFDCNSLPSPVPHLTNIP